MGLTQLNFAGMNKIEVAMNDIVEVIIIAHQRQDRLSAEIAHDRCNKYGKPCYLRCKDNRECRVAYRKAFCWYVNAQLN